MNHPIFIHTQKQFDDDGLPGWIEAKLETITEVKVDKVVYFISGNRLWIDKSKYSRISSAGKEMGPILSTKDSLIYQYQKKLNVVI